LSCVSPCLSYFCFSDPPPPATSTLSLHDALPISQAGAVARRQGRQASRASPCPAIERSRRRAQRRPRRPERAPRLPAAAGAAVGDRKSTRLNSSHLGISYAVFCLKKKKKKKEYD